MRYRDLILIISNKMIQQKRQEEEKTIFQSNFSQISKQQFESRFLQQVEIGEGSTCTVFRAVDKCNGRQKVALKKLHSKVLRDYNLYDQITKQITILDFVKDFKQQKVYFINLLYKLKVTRANELCQYYLVFQLCDKSYQQAIQNPNFFMSIPFVDRLHHCITIAEGLKFLHGYQILHRDIKPANIFLRFQNGISTALIGDFGHTKNLSLHMTSNKGSPKYIDPQLKNTGNYSSEWDVYSFGLTILQILTGRFFIPLSPKQMSHYDQFQTKMNKALKNIKFTLANFTNLSEPLKNVIEHCLTEKKNRWTMEKVLRQLQDIYIKQLQNECKINKQIQIQKISTTNSFVSKTPNSKLNKMQQIQISGKQTIKQKNQGIKQKIITLSQNSKFKSNTIFENNKSVSQILIQPNKKQIHKESQNENAMSNKSQNCSTKQFNLLNISPKKILSQKQMPLFLSPTKLRKIQSEKANFEILKPVENKSKFSYECCNNIECKLLQTNKMMENSSQKYDARVKKIGKLQQMHKDLKRIQKLQKMQTEDKPYKMVLISFAYLHFKAKLKDLDANELDNLEFINKVKKVFDPIVQMTKKKYSQYLTNKNSKLILSNGINNTKDIQNQYKHIAHNIKCNLNLKQLQQVIM